MDELDIDEIRTTVPARTLNSVIKEDTGGQETQDCTRNRRRLRRSRRVCFETPTTERTDVRRVGTGAQRTQDGWLEHVSHQKVKVHVELNPADWEDILDDCDGEPNVETIYKDNAAFEQNGILDVEGNPVPTESDNEEEWESNDLSSSTSDDDFTLDHVMQKWGVD